MALMRDVVLLVALPASGKSEIRRALDHLDDAGRRVLGIGVPVHLDDYPYVYVMRCISAEAIRLGVPPPLYPSQDLPLHDRRDWSTLTALLDEDAAAVLGEGTLPPGDGEGMLRRLDRIRSRFGLGAEFAAMDPGIRSGIAGAVSADAAKIAEAVRSSAAAWREGATTLIVEFARGGPKGSRMPLPEPLGYRHALGLLSPSLLERAMLLSVLVTPEDSRRRNRERARPGDAGRGSIMNHKTSEAVMRAAYGCDDIGWLLETARRPGTIDVPRGDGTVTLPAARIDNRDDLTSHLRGDPKDWDPVATAELHRRLAAAITSMTGGEEQ